MSTINVNRMVDSQGGVLAPISSVMRNRIINGAMTIDQRNAGASVTPTDEQYTIDRWISRATQSSKFTVQQNAGSVTPPVGFTKYLGVTSSSAYSVVASDFFSVNQPIEGFNLADLNWGTANAQTVTVSFWVRSSLTGTFAGAIRNNASDYNYPFSYSISAANTWEQKVITITGATSGTWATSNNRCAIVEFALGTGSDRHGTANAWNASNVWSFSGATSVVGTSGATFYITGVQLEKGTQATGFEYRQYGTELALCQRYFQWTAFSQGFSSYAAGTFLTVCVPFQAVMRTVPSFAIITADPNSAQAGSLNASNSFNAAYSTVNSGQAGLAASGAGNCFVYGYRSATSAEL